MGDCSVGAVFELLRSTRLDTGGTVLLCLNDFFTLRAITTPILDAQPCSHEKVLSSSSLLQTPPCSIVCASACGPTLGKLTISDFTESGTTNSGKKLVYPDLYDYAVMTIGASHGWAATLNKDDWILRLQDDLNPYASDTNPKCISLPPLVALPHCQTKIITYSSPEDEDCVVAVKFLGPQLNFCRPSAAAQSEWTNSHVFQERRHVSHPRIWRPQLGISKPSKAAAVRTRGYAIVLYDRALDIQETRRDHRCCFQNETNCVLTLKLDEKGNAVLMGDIGDLVIFISRNEPFCVPASSFPGLVPNHVYISDVDEFSYVHLSRILILNYIGTYPAPYHIPPQNIN
ncbi:hypothetical protein EUTSA_v10023176mg [Eutrema salsugineum]|uniref:KIB1-4 beta-propeller domain-containing protein n=1 Tax=Eutrema salsugineum TaxID=72664 RepID=V4LJX0_EUTSA|nr:hypothetical protein EUTSA_v10023176mg [Eutrema salsugineum]